MIHTRTTSVPPLISHLPRLPAEVNSEEDGAGPRFSNKKLKLDLSGKPKCVN